MQRTGFSPVKSRIMSDRFSPVKLRTWTSRFGSVQKIWTDFKLWYRSIRGIPRHAPNSNPTKTVWEFGFGIMSLSLGLGIEFGY
jgi:hypothetical protein